MQPNWTKTINTNRNLILFNENFNRNIMISKNQIQFIKSLQNKKERSDKQIFTAEGSRLILDLIKHFARDVYVHDLLHAHASPNNLKY